MALNSTLGLDDTEGLLWEPSCLTVDPLGALLDKDGEEPLPGGPTSPFSSSLYYADTSLTSPLSVVSPPSPLSSKVGTELLSLRWLSDELLDATISADSSKEDAFSGMDWMAEKIDLSEFDLDSLMGSCDSEEAPSSPEDLIASLDSPMDLDPLPLSDPLFTPFATQEISDHLSEFPSHPQIDTEVKSEPPSPGLPSSLSPPPSPSFTLDLGSEVDISANEKSAPVENTPVPKIVLSLSPSLVVLLSPKEELTGASSTAATLSSDDQSDSDSGIGSVSGSPPHWPCSSPLHPGTSSSRTKPYSIPSKSKETPQVAALTVKVKSVSSGTTKVVEKKLKKMEQNKTAATRYRQKKRAEQEALNSECTELEKKNRELAEKAESIRKEIQYLKDLMEEVRKAKSRRSSRSNVTS